MDQPGIVFHRPNKGIMSGAIDQQCYDEEHHVHMVGDGHQPNSRGLYTHYSIRIPIRGGMTIPCIGSLDPGTYNDIIQVSESALCKGIPLWICQ